MIKQFNVDTKKLNQISKNLLEAITKNIQEHKYVEGTNLGTVCSDISGEINVIVAEYEEKEEPIHKSLMDKYNTFNEYTSPDISEYFLNKEEYNMMYKKFNKTVKRCKSIINVSWNNLSDKYKRQLVKQCENNNEISLFNVSDTCKAYVDCQNNFVVQSSTEECFDKNLLNQEEEKEN